MDCQNLVFSQKQSQKRIEKALRFLPSLLLKKLVFFALYLLGARFKAIASLVEIPEETGKTTVHRVMKEGISAFIDRRQPTKSYGAVFPSQAPQTSVLIEEDYCIITFGDMDHQLKILLKHRVHL